LHSALARFCSGAFERCEVKPVGASVSELRINYGPGYSVYYLKKGTELNNLLAGGDKSSQAKDINEAHLLVDNLTGET